MQIRYGDDAGRRFILETVPQRVWSQKGNAMVMDKSVPPGVVQVVMQNTGALVNEVLEVAIH